MKHVMAILAGLIVASGAPSAKAEPGVLESLGQGKRLFFFYFTATTEIYTKPRSALPLTTLVCFPMILPLCKTCLA